MGFMNRRVVTTVMAVAAVCMTFQSASAASGPHLRHHVSVIQPLHTGACARVILILRTPTGRRATPYPAGGRHTPRYSIPMILPLERGSIRTYRVPHYMEGSTYMQGYPKYARAGYWVPTGVHRTLRWYAHALEACGFTRLGSGYSTGPKQPEVYELDSTGTGDDSQHVNVTVASIRSGGSRVVLAASASGDPRRPAASYVPASAASMTIVYYGEFNTKPVHVTVTDQSLIQDVASAFNSANHLQGELFLHCPFGIPHADVRFNLPSGKHVQASFGEPCGNTSVSKWVNGHKQTWWLADSGNVQTVVPLAIRVQQLMSNS
jgi:hypothetical protein